MTTNADASAAYLVREWMASACMDRHCCGMEDRLLAVGLETRTGERAKGAQREGWRGGGEDSCL